MPGPPLATGSHFMLRRDFLSVSALAIGATTGGTGSSGPFSGAKSILDYGAKPDGKTLNTKVIQRAIDEANGAGGGIVYAPPGIFLIGGLELKSRVTLYLEAGCVLLGSTSFDDYEYHPGPRFSGGTTGYHLIFANAADDVTLCGPGIIDGQGSAYWQATVGRASTTTSNTWWDAASQHYEAKDDRHRPSPMIEFAECRNVRIKGITLKNSPSWTLRAVGCETVVIDGIRIRNPRYGVNSDGIDISSQNVMISNCDIVAGDDAICLKSDNPYGGSLSTKNVTITNCVLTTSCNGFKLGTASAGAFENIVFSNSVIYADSNSPLNTHVIGGINIEVVDGGTADGVVISNIRMQDVRAPIFIRLGERWRKRGTFLRNVMIENLDATGAIFTSSITGVPGLRPSDITVSNCRIRTMEQGQREWIRREIPEMADKYPEAWMMGRLPAYGFFVRHADRVRLRNVECITDKPDGRPAIVADDVKDLILAGLELAAPVGDAAVIELRNSHQVFIAGMRMPLGAKVLAEISGADSSDISFAENSFEPDQKTVIYTDGATVEARGPRISK
jgi:polygalacturonase